MIILHCHCQIESQNQKLNRKIVRFNLDSRLRVLEPLLYQLSNQVSWEQRSRKIHFIYTRDFRDNLTLMKEDVP